MVVNFKNKRAFKDIILNNIISTLGRHVMLVILKYPFRQDGNLLSTFNKQTKNSIMPIYSITRPKKLVKFLFSSIIELNFVVYGEMKQEIS